MDVNPITILLIEDDGQGANGVRDLVRQAGSAGGGRLLEARGFTHGLELAASGEVDVLLLALPHPDQQGLAVLEHVRATAPELPIVVITELDDDPTAALTLHGCAQDFLPRAHLSTGLLLRSIRYAVDRYRMQCTLRQLSLMDEMTGLYNRRGFLTMAEYHLRLAHRTRGLLVGLFEIHPISDDARSDEAAEWALAFGADLLRLAFRVSDVIARLGGCEFAVLAVDAATDALPIIEQRLSEQARIMAAAGSAQPPMRIAAALEPVASLDGIEPFLSQLKRMRGDRRFLSTNWSDAKPGAT